MEKTSKCRKCKYSSPISVKNESEYACMYIVDECEPRGCPAGDECTKFKPRTGYRKTDLTGILKEKVKIQRFN